MTNIRPDAFVFAIIQPDNLIVAYVDMIVDARHLDDQLKPGVRMVIPIGLPHMYQELMLVAKGKGGTTPTDSVMGVSFVPLVMVEDEASTDLYSGSNIG